MSEAVAVIPAAELPARSDELLYGADGRLSRGWRVVVVSVLAMIVGPPPVLILAFGLWIPQFHAAFGWDVRQVSLGATIISLMLIVVAPLQGYLTDRLGCRRLVLISIPLFGIGVLAMSQMGPNIALFYAACAMLPFAGIGLWPLTYMKMTSTWFERRLGLALGTLNMGNGLGGFLMPLFLVAVFATLGWRAAYVILGLANLLIAWPLAALFLRERPTAEVPSSGTQAKPTYGLELGAAVRTRPFAIVATTFFVIGLLSTAYLVHQVAILIDAGIAPSRASYFQAWLGLASIVGQLAAGWLLDRVSANRVVAGMLALIASASVIYTTSYAAIFAPVTVITVGFMIGSEMNILGYVIKRHFGERAFGKLYGIVFACFSLGGGVGAQILAISRSSLNSYTPGLLLMAGLCSIVAIMFLRLPRPLFSAPGDVIAAH